MKTPLVALTLACFLIMATSQTGARYLIDPYAKPQMKYEAAGNVQFVNIQYSNDMGSWTTVITNLDLSTAVFNPETGKKEIHLEVELPESCTNQGFFRFVDAASPMMISQTFGLAPVVTVPKCNMIIITVIMLVVAGVCIYLLVKTCQKYLPPSTNG